MIARNRVPLGILVPLSKIDVHLPLTFDEPDIKLIEQYRKIDRLKKTLQCLRPHFNDKTYPVVTFNRNDSLKILFFDVA
jgi:hypothetical protein